jgi:hypothetical protein
LRRPGESSDAGREVSGSATPRDGGAPRILWIQRIREATGKWRGRWRRPLQAICWQKVPAGGYGAFLQGPVRMV